MQGSKEVANVHRIQDENLISVLELMLSQSTTELARVEFFAHYSKSTHDKLHMIMVLFLIHVIKLTTNLQFSIQ